MLFEYCSFEFIVISLAIILDILSCMLEKLPPQTHQITKIAQRCHFLNLPKTKKIHKLKTSQHIWNGSSCTGILNCTFALSLHSEKSKDGRAISGHVHLSSKELNSEATHSTSRKLGRIIIALQFSSFPLNLGLNWCLENTCWNLLKTYLFQFVKGNRSITKTPKAK